MAKFTGNKVAFLATWGGRNDPAKTGEVKFKLELPLSELPATIYISGLVDTPLHVSGYLDGERFSFGACTRGYVRQSSDGSAVIEFQTLLQDFELEPGMQGKLIQKALAIVVEDLSNTDTSAPVDDVEDNE